MNKICGALKTGAEFRPGWDRDLEGDPWVLGTKSSPRARSWEKPPRWSPPPNPWHPVGAGQHRAPLGSPRSHPRPAEDQPRVGGLALAFRAPKLSPARVGLQAQTHTRASKMISMPPRLPSDVGGPGERNASDRIHVSSRCRSAQRRRPPGIFLWAIDLGSIRAPARFPRTSDQNLKE